MISRALLSRINAGKTTEPVKAEKSKTIYSTDAVSGELVNEFESMDDAEKAGFNKPSIMKSIKSGTKYRGNLWGTK